ncbi:hypothetical protein LSAT2_014179 [Lamellibrachia satsuma]|nr:hypothetical protein LSAT2_014179 [Lamellibrachia satsuma]
MCGTDCSVGPYSYSARVIFCLSRWLDIADHVDRMTELMLHDSHRRQRDVQQPSDLCEDCLSAEADSLVLGVRNHSEQRLTA